MLAIRVYNGAWDMAGESNRQDDRHVKRGVAMPERSS